MMIRVCSGFAPAAKDVYGDRFVQTFHSFWPANHQLRVYVEQPVPMPRGACRDLWAIPGASAFYARHRDNLVARGLEQRDGWKDSDRRKGYSFRFDALKFFKQILIPGAAAEDMADGNVLVWLDGDVQTIRPVPVDLVERLLGTSDVCFFGRDPKHSEIGFWAVRLNSRTRDFLRLIAETYTTDRFLELPQWHSAFVWDWARRQSGLVERNLCPPGARGHVWPMTQLGRYTTHHKGDRKGKGL